MDFVIAIFGVMAAVFFVLFAILLIYWLVKRMDDNEKRHAKERQVEQLGYQGRMRTAQGQRTSGMCPSCGANTGGMMRCPSCGEYN